MLSGLVSTDWSSVVFGNSPKLSSSEGSTLFAAVVSVVSWA